MSNDNLVMYHNPNCSKSRETLQILRDNNRDPVIVEYLEYPPDEDELRRIIGLLGVDVRDLLRTTEPVYHDAELDDDTISEDELIEAICEYPALLQRPIVVAGDRAVIGRPPSKVLEIIA